MVGASRLRRARLLACCSAVAIGCVPPADPPGNGNGTGPGNGAVGNGNGNGNEEPPLPCEIHLALGAEDEAVVEGTTDDGGLCELVLEIPFATVVEISAESPARVSLSGLDDDEEPGWLPPRVVEAGTHFLRVEAPSAFRVVVYAHGPPTEPIRRERSLVWIDPVLIDDPSVAGLGRLLDAAAGGEGGGRLFASWMRRFATTAHSERVGPLMLLEAIEDEHGADPDAWDLDALPFVVTGIHNRIDLAAAEPCGELRVSVASVHSLHQPFHLIFLFRQVPGEGDVSPGGVVHCGGTARGWARLSALSGDALSTEVAAWVDRAVTAETFLLAETLEFIVSPWEWRQWVRAPDEPTVLENVPLFQTVDVARVNAPGPDRDAFLAFVEANAAALDARRLAIPERFRAPSARLNAGVPWVPLDLTGVDTDVLDAFPDLRRHLEIVGCPACHATDAEFVQTRHDRTFSPFYDTELDARAEHLEALQRGAPVDAPFGPLQAAPRLPP